MQSPTSLIELEDSDHMATGRLDALSVRLKQALERLSLQDRLRLEAGRVEFWRPMP